MRQTSHNETTAKKEEEKAVLSKYYNRIEATDTDIRLSETKHRCVSSLNDFDDVQGGQSMARVSLPLSTTLQL